MGTGRELMAGCTRGITGRKEPVCRTHIGIAPLVGGVHVFGTAHPGTGGTGVGTNKIRLAGRDFRVLLFGLDIQARPEMCLGDSHIQEVFPCLGLEFLHLFLVAFGIILEGICDLVNGLIGLHVKRT